MTIDTAIHKKTLVKILKDIFTNQAIAPYLCFKGGTAALLFYHLNRFSVDLDFDLLDENKEDPSRRQGAMAGKQFDEEYRELLVSELLLAAMQEDDVSVKNLAQAAGVVAAPKDPIR